MENTISIEIPATFIEAVGGKLAEVESMFKPFKSMVPDAEKPPLRKVADKTIPFVDKVTSYTKTAPEYTPDHMDVPEFYRDRAALDALLELEKPCLQLLSRIQDLQALTANDSMAAALKYYRNVKFAAKEGDAKAKPIYEDLAKRFPGRPGKRKAAAATTK
jgi:hypothetical protein